MVCCEVHAEMNLSQSRTAFTSRAVCQYYYSSSDDGTIWRCRKCSQLKTKNGGWTNLLSHLKSCAGHDYMEQYKSQVVSSIAAGGKSAKGVLQNFVLRLSDTEKEISEWINFLVMKNQPLSIVNCPIMRKIVRLKPVCAKTLRKYLLSLVVVVRADIKARLPNKFALIFDGWTEGTDHYIGIWASYNVILPQNEESGKETTTQSLLSIRPLLADGIDGMTAKDHLCHIQKVLNVYGKEQSNVICLVGDNCNVNQSIARTMCVPLIGCASHKFNLAVRRWMDSQPELVHIIAKVAAVMKKASTLKVAAKLRQQTKYSCVKENDTRWSSTYYMIQRFFLIQRELNALVEVLTLLPTPVEVDILSRGFKCLEKFNAITIMLQAADLTFVDARRVFDILISDFPQMEHHLGSEGRLVTDKNFEMGVMRLSNGVPLTNDQLNAVANLLKVDRSRDTASLQSFHHGQSDAGDTGSSDDEEVSYAVRVAKRLKVGMHDERQRDKYMNLDVIPGTSVNCERLFSLAKYILTDTRKSTQPIVFEALLFLKVNRHIWDAHSVGKAMGRSVQMDENDGLETVGNVNHVDDDAYGEFVDHLDVDDDSYNSPIPHSSEGN